ncbi:MAG: TonB-dependent receptor [Acidobacteria bacterium]|nr:TonB-dependent receptor [Acidobacteriota bacterium]
MTITSEEGERTFVTDAEGRFFAPFLPPATYTVRVELSGFQPVERTNVGVRLGQRVTLTDLVLRIAGVAEAIEVRAAAPVVDVTTTTAGSVLDSTVLRHLPVGRGITDVVLMAPGVSDSSGVGRANPSISGGSGLENAYVVDGVNITNAGYGGIGSYSIVFNSLGSGVTYDFVRETQIKTAGFEAEFGQATGGVVNVVTKSGTNVFHGSGFGHLRSKALETAWRQIQTPNGTVNTTGSTSFDVGAGAGGRIVRDRLFFYGTYNYVEDRRTFIAPSGFPLERLGGVDRVRFSNSYAGKLTWQQRTNHRIDFSVFGDPSKGDMGPQREVALLAVDTARFSELTKYGTHTQTGRYDAILSPTWLLEVSVSRSKNNFVETPSVNQHFFNDATVTPTRRFGGIGFFDSNQPGVNVQYQAKSTNIFDTGAAGDHQIRYGVAFEDITFTREFGRTGPPFTLPNGQQTRTGASVTILPDPVFGRIYRATRANFGPAPRTTQDYLNFFVQDTWQLGRLTVRPGIRYEQQELVGGDPPLCHADDTRPGLGDGTGALIRCRIKWDSNWGPRIGGTYDLLGNGRSKVYANWGRFYAKVPNDLAARSLSADAGISRGDYFDEALTRPVPEGVLAAGQTRHFILAGLHAAEFDPDAKSTYKDEFLAGAEFEVLPETSAGIRYIHRDMPRILEDIGTAQMVLYDLGVPGLESVEYFITNVNRNTKVFPATAGVTQAHFEDPVHEYNAVELTLDRRLANNWSAFASYRWSRLRGNFEGFYRSDNNQSDPAITSLFDFPTNDPSYTEIGVPRFGYRGDIRFLGCSLGCGVLPNDRTHQVKIFSTYGWRDLNFGLGLNAGSGRSLTELAANPNYANSGEIPVTVRGAGFRTADGVRKRAPMDFSIDVHADYAVRLIGERAVTVLVDIFNLTNRREPDNYDNCSDIGFGTTNANFGQPVNGCARSWSSFQAPLATRVGVRFDW